MSLPSASVSGECHVRVDLRAQDLGEAHDLARGIGDLEPHAALAGYRLDHADAHHRQRPREVAHEIDDLAALDADRGLDLVAGDHRSGIGRDHLHLDAEVEQLLLDQARGELERVRAQHLDASSPARRAGAAAAAANPAGSRTAAPASRARRAPTSESRPPAARCGSARGSRASSCSPPPLPRARSPPARRPCGRHAPATCAQREDRRASIQPPTRSITVSHDTPAKRPRPAASNSDSRTSVPPVKPSAFARPSPTSAPSIPPGA